MTASLHNEVGRLSSPLPSGARMFDGAAGADPARGSGPRRGLARLLLPVLLAASSFACGGGGSPRPPSRDLVDARLSDAPAVVDSGRPEASAPELPDAVDDVDDTDDASRCRSHEECDDENACTADICDVAGRCVHTPSNGPCDDGDACTQDEICRGGRCEGRPIDCGDPGGACSGIACDPAEGCVPYCRDLPECARECAADEDCDDGNPDSVDFCTVGACSAACVRLWPLCDDDNPCTADRPDDDGTCRNEPLDGIPCDDGSACTVDERCIGDVCAGTLVPCDDGSPCTAEHCDRALGCIFEQVPDGVGCSDGDLCTAQDTCVGGVCLTSPVVCPDDGDPCSFEYCASELGCTAYCRRNGECAPECAVDADCADADPCTRERCVATLCTTHCEYPETSCDDGEFCTIDYCDAAQGACRHIVFCEECVYDEDCDNGDPCTEDYCNPDKFCERDPITCAEDEDPCTTAVCQAVQGCTQRCVEPCPAACSAHGDCDDDDTCTEDLCLMGPCGLRCRNRPLECAPAGPCGVALCVVGGCVDSVPAASPTLDGVVGNDWHTFSLGGLELDPSDWPAGYLTELHVQNDENLLFVGIRGLAVGSTQAIVGYLDVDHGAGSGVSRLSAIHGGSGALDEALSGCATLISPAFGADVAFGTVDMTSAYGTAERAGWRRLGSDGVLRRIYAGALVTSVDEHGVEATIPLDTLLPGGVPPEGAAMALVVLLTDTADGCLYADQSLPDQSRPLTGESPQVAAVFRFVVQPTLWGCCVHEEDCRDADPCTSDVCTPSGTCDHLETGCMDGR